MIHQPRISFSPTYFDLPEEQRPADRVSRILQEVSETFNVTINDLRGSEKTRWIAHARQYAYTRLRDETAMSYPAIARVMCRKDHTTIISGIDACRARIKKGMTA